MAVGRVMLTGALRYWSRRFKKHMERKRASRMSGVPHLTVPDILVVNDSQSESDREGSGGPLEPDEGPAARWAHLSVGEDGPERRDRTSREAGSSQRDGPYQHPLSLPRRSMSTESQQSGSSRLSFDPYEPEGQGQSQGQSQGAGQMSRRGSAVSSTQARELLEDSVWMESIRRSATLRRPARGSRRYGDSG